MMIITRRFAFAAAFAALFIAPLALAASKSAANRAVRFWDFPGTAALQNAAPAENTIRFTAAGAELGNFLLKLPAAHRPAGFGANVFALSLAQTREFASPLDVAFANSFTSASFDIAASAGNSITGSSAYQFLDFPGLNRVPPPDTPEPGTFFGAALGFVGFLWLQRRRLAALVK